MGEAGRNGYGGDELGFLLFHTPTQQLCDDSRRTVGQLYPMERFHSVGDKLSTEGRAGRMAVLVFIPISGSLSKCFTSALSHPGVAALFQVQSSGATLSGGASTSTLLRILIRDFCSRSMEQDSVFPPQRA